MHIIHVVPQYLPSTGGMETYVSSLNRQLTRLGHRSDVATLDYIFKTNEPLPHYQRLDSTNVIRLPSSGNPRYFFAPRLMEMAPRYDVIHVHGVDFFVDLLGACKGAHGRPLVLSTHGGFFHTPWMPALKSAFFQTVTRFSLRGVDRVIASSPTDEQLFSRISSRVTLVENGIDYENFALVRNQPAADSLLFIGRISKNKRVDLLLETLSLLRRQRPLVTLKVVGSDWEGLRAGLEQQADELGIADAVEFTGVVPPDRLLAELTSARLFVSASDYEAFGLFTVEAMAAGLVPVVSRIPAFMDLVEDGETGFLTDYRDPAAAAASIRQALELSDARLVEMRDAARRAASRYDWSRVVNQIVDIYEEVIAQSRAYCHR